jgi:hypothetical protein
MMRGHESQPDEIANDGDQHESSPAHVESWETEQFGDEGDIIDDKDQVRIIS